MGHSGFGIFVVTSDDEHAAILRASWSSVSAGSSNRLSDCRFFSLLASPHPHLKERGHGEAGRTHESEAESQSRLRLLLRCLAEFFDDAVALELGNVVDEEHAVDVVDLVLEAGSE